ncbi:MAG: tetratricopeptide repeat protein, partial [Silvanigrellaceae bacterium]|nr:tetratricopeptide repeat protein [Silvanigrellaceae bacterium]
KDFLNFTKTIVVDDQLPIRKAISRILEKNGMQNIEQFSSVKDAIAWLKNHEANLIISDIYFPVGSGFDILSYVRNRAMKNDLPVLFISGEATKDDIVRSVDMGVADYLLKPFEVQDLVVKVTILLEKYTRPDAKTQNLRAAEDLYLSGKYEEAQVAYALICEIEKNARAIVGLALTEYKLGNKEKAIGYVEEAIKSNAMYFPAYSLGADIMLEKKNYLQAEHYILMELKINGKQSQRRLQLANIYFVQGKIDKAFEQMRLGLVENPGNEVFLMRFAGMYYQLKDKEKAVHYYLKARRQNPKSNKPLSSLAAMFLQDNEPEKVLRIFTDLLNKNKNQYDVYLARAKLYEKLGESEKALNDLCEIPNTAQEIWHESLKYKSRLYSKMNKLSEALVAAEELIELEKNADNFARAGLIELKLSNYQKAVIWYEKSVALDPKNTLYLFNLACAYEGAKQYPKAILTYEKSIELDPSKAEFKIALQRLKNRIAVKQ